jgi:hypothetical protein
VYFFISNSVENPDSVNVYNQTQSTELTLGGSDVILLVENLTHINDICQDDGGI